MSFIGLEPSTQWTSWGSCIGSHNEAELAQDTCARTVPKLQAAGHRVQVFAGQQDANSDGAYALAAAHPDVAVSMHLDSAGGGPTGLLCYQEQRSLAMGITILNTYCQHMGYRSRGAEQRIPGQNGVATIRIPESAGIPTALIEMGDMACPDGTSWLDPNHREKASAAMAAAICAAVGGSVPPVTKKEDEMDLSTSGVPVTDWYAPPVYIGVQGSHNWMAWAKMLNLNHKEGVKVKVWGITKDSVKIKEATIQVNIPWEVSASDLGMKGSGWFHMWAEKPVTMGSDYRDMA